MVYCESQLRLLFMQYNMEYFGDILPMPIFKIRHSVNILGYFSYWPDEPYGTTETIEISDFYDYKPNQLRDILVHEMVHYYLYYTGEDMRVRHGKAFKKMAKYLNKTFGLHITPTIDLSKYKPRPDAPYLKRLYFRLFC